MAENSATAEETSTPKVRALNVVLLDDSVDKFSMLRDALKDVNTRSALAGCNLEHYTRALTLIDKPVEELADVDVFFIDFHLYTGRYQFSIPTITVSTLREFAPDPATRKSREVEVTTGMGVLLYLDETFRSEEYLTARGDRPAAVVYTYVDMTEARARYFAVAALSWFGVQPFLVTSRAPMAANLEQHPHPQLGAARIAEAVPLLDALLNHFTRANTPEWVTKPGSEAYFWLRLLGRHQCDSSPKTYSPLLTRYDINATTTLYDGLVGRLYAKVRAFEAALIPADVAEWPRPDHAALRPQARRRLATELNESELFWEADDVKVAMLFRRPVVARRANEAAKAAAGGAAAAAAEEGAEDGAEDGAAKKRNFTYDAKTRSRLRRDFRRNR